MDDNVGERAQDEHPSPLPVVVMGPSGCGKTTLGRNLAQWFGCDFEDADDHHPPANVEKMRSGLGLTDDDRAPWLEHLGEILCDRPRLVMACSALKKSYRNILRDSNPHVKFLLLDVPRSELERRLNDRLGHFAGVSLLESQLTTLELPDDEAFVFVIDGTGSEEEILHRALSSLGARS